MSIMLPRIRRIEPQDGYRLLVDFDEGERVIYDVGNDIDQIPAFSNLRSVPGLFANARLDSSRTIVEWSDEIDLPSDTIYEYGQKETSNH